MPAAGVLHILIGVVTGPYSTRHQRGSFDEVVSVGRTVTLTALFFFVVVTVVQPPLLVPRSVPLLGGAVALVGMLAVRFVARAWRARRFGRREAEARAIVIGAGVTGRSLVHSMLFGSGQYVPVAIVDEDRGMRRQRVDGIKVLTGLGHIPRIAERKRATHLVVALPDADAQYLREVAQIGDATGLQVKVLPAIDDMFNRADVQDLRDVDLEDLLGRRPVLLDQEAIAAQITGQVVLVTGAGGSIGSELCRQIARYRPARLLMLERDESGLHATQLSLTGRGLLEGEDLLLADIRERGRLHQLFLEHRPDVVFHAAALKHLTLLEKNPSEAWMTNVQGTYNVLSAAAASGVGVFINVSTDKAAAPTSALGYSKRIAERLTAEFARKHAGRYVSVRFGNVLGSRGSVIPIFTEQIRTGQPVTVTHPDVERYFMLIPEACQLVLQACVMGGDGEAMVLDMGEPVKIADVARTLMRMAGQEVPILYTGLRPGEKLSEDLFTDSEHRRETGHPLVRSVDVPPISGDFINSSTYPDSVETLRRLALHPVSEAVMREGSR
ncbi:polysaccharide biosynthesis protein [Ornithinimicrobium avium]|uniref:Polysaccharide biosynthesis protein n=2 Tax=Ornithinimicrobium avium TaxID=2283195 RepID=A0A345NSU5_9MICO|nr:polysaccharide biosynthesis protein [Ornithinimicrobium avium]